MSATPDLPAGAALTRSGGVPGDAERAILRTVTYAGLFRSPLSLDRLHRVLMDVPLDPDSIVARLRSPFLRARLTLSGDLVVPRGREVWLAERERRRRKSEELLARHRRALRLLAAFPFVRLVALSGACAHENATDDDVDVFLLVERGRAWSVCLLLMVLSKVMGLRRTLCVNYVIDEAAAALPEQDLFTASEIVGMRPLAGRAGYEAFLRANRWAALRYPNFFGRAHEEAAGLGETRFPRSLERLAAVGPAQAFEAASRWLLGAYLRRRMEGLPGVVLDRHRLKLHALDHRMKLLDRFDRAVQEAEAAP